MREKELEGISEEIFNGQKLCKIKQKKPQTKEDKRTPSRINTHAQTHLDISQSNC